MTSRDFCYWLQGFFELNASVPHDGLSEEQAATIERHLAMVFRHEIDPSFGKDKAVLQEIHDQGAPAGPEECPPSPHACSHDIKYTC